ncbi:MAG: NYN domain-containing protein [Alphaproteobacteria bacterium]|nr:NYN domain-containing protein [Alphaproteobacteria bacterium]
MSNQNTQPLLAVLIDADNTSYQWAEAIFTEIASLGEASVRRIYGDFSTGHLKSWNSKMATYAIIPYQQFAYTVGKNSSDIALVIDAMDLLHANRVEGFVLVSSDSDFTRLASRIREQGFDVYGIGQKKTPEAFRKACKRFIFVENLLPSPKKAAGKGANGTQEPPSKSIPKINEAIRNLDDENGWYSLSSVGQQLLANHPDFDARTYGSAKLGDLLESTGSFEVDRKTRPARARRMLSPNS